MEQKWIGFDLSDPEQAAVYTIIENTKRGSKGKMLTGCVVHMLASHGLQNALSQPTVAARLIDEILKVPSSPPPPSNASAVIPATISTAEKKKPKKEKKESKVPEPEKSIPAPAPAIKEEKKEGPKITSLPSPTPAEAPATDDDDGWLDPRFPWREPGGMMKIIQSQEDMEALGIEGEPPVQYLIDLEDFALRHPEAAPQG